MFEGCNTDVKNALDILSIAKIVYDFSGEILVSNIDSDFIWDIYLEAMASIFKESSEDCIEGAETSFWIFHDPVMTEYYKLCHEYGKKHHVRYRNNPYVRRADEAVDESMRSINSYSYGWSLFNRADKSMSAQVRKYGPPPCLVFETDCEFYQVVEAVQSVAEIATYFKTGVEELKKELCAPGAQSPVDNPKILLLDVSVRQEAKEAA